jgi:predicted Kef-type K+ transport protein
VGSGWQSLSLAAPAWIAFALALGMLAKSLRLPALVGFLVAGFLLNALGAQPSPFIEEIADLGITLLLFTIGLHLSIRMFARPEVWAVGLGHMALSTGVLTLVVIGGGALGIGPLVSLGIGGALALGLALSFSSTVFAVKALEDRGAQRTRHGRIALGVLVIQDLVAVVFLATATDARPSSWALLLLGLPLLRRPLLALLEHAGHGELLILFGVVVAIGGAALFELVGLKADLGALVAGFMLAGSPKSAELSRAMDGFKDLFLVGFFVSIGLDVPLSAVSFALGCLLLLAIPVKAAGFLLLFSAARLRARTAWQATLDLATFSEFGLIVVAAAVESALLPDSLLTSVAVAVALSLVVAAPFATRGDALYARFREPLRRLQRAERLEGDEDLHVKRVDVVVFGLGRLGSSALEAVELAFPDRVLGVDVSPRTVAAMRAQGHNVVLGDATDPEFWSRTEDLVHRLDWVLLTMASHEANLAAVERLRARGFTGRIVATSRYPDQADELRELGVGLVFDVYAEAGSGFASDLQRRFEQERDDSAS